MRGGFGEVGGGCGVVVDDEAGVVVGGEGRAVSAALVEDEDV